MSVGGSANIDCGKVCFKEHHLEVTVVPAKTKLFRDESCFGLILVANGHYLDVREFYEDGKVWITWAIQPTPTTPT